jgi:hypothetical protein
MNAVVGVSGDTGVILVATFVCSVAIVAFSVFV